MQKLYQYKNVLMNHNSVCGDSCEGRGAGGGGRDDMCSINRGIIGSSKKSFFHYILHWPKPHPAEL